MTFDKRIINVSDLPLPTSFNVPPPPGSGLDLTLSWLAENWPADLPFVWLIRLGSDADCRHFFQPGECEAFEFSSSITTLVTPLTHLAWSICLRYFIGEVRNMADKEMGGFWILVRPATPLERTVIDFIRGRMNQEWAQLLGNVLMASAAFANWVKEKGNNGEPAQIQQRRERWIGDSQRALEASVVSQGTIGLFQEMMNPIKTLQHALGLEL